MRRNRKVSDHFVISKDIPYLTTDFINYEEEKDKPVFKYFILEKHASTVYSFFPYIHILVYLAVDCIVSGKKHTVIAYMCILLWKKKP